MKLLNRHLAPEPTSASSGAGSRSATARALGRLGALAFAGVLAATVPAQAGPLTYDLSFNTSGQSIWDSGDSFRLNETKFLGVAWQDKKAGVDLMTGSEDSRLINPLRVTYDAAFATCRGLGNSSSVCINGQKARAPVPKLGSRPSVRSCGKFAVGCKIKRAGDLTKRAAYDVAFKACRGLGNSSSVCRNGQSGRLPVPALGTAPARFLTVDTRSGVEAEATSDGKVGLELGVSIDSGSVDATVSYQATLDVPDATLLNKANPINFNPSSQLAGTNTLDTSFSSIEVNVDAIMQLSGGVTGEACAVGACAAGGATYDIDERAEILSFNKDGEGGLKFVGLSPADLGISTPGLSGLPITLDVAGLAEATLHLPQPNATGGLDSSGEKLTATGQDDLLDLILDLDNIVATAAGVPGLFGNSFSFGGAEVGFDIINLQMGPTIDLQQDFELDPTLFVTLEFDQAVMVGGQIVTELTSAWDMLPDILFLSDVTKVTPTFFVEADLLNSTLLDFDLEMTIDLLQVFYEFALLNIDGGFGIGNILQEAIDLFDSPAFYSKMFALGGFDLQIGDSFMVDFLNSQPSAPTAAGARSAVNPIVLAANPLAVSEPEGIALILMGLSAIVILRRRRSGSQV